MADPTARKPDPSSTDAAGRGSPYGPQPHGVDLAAGGADSSPHETEPAGEDRRDAAGQRRGGRPSPPSDPHVR